MKSHSRSLEKALKQSFECSVSVRPQQVESAWHRVLGKAVDGVSTGAEKIPAAAKWQGSWTRPLIAVAGIALAVIVSIAVTQFRGAAAVIETANGERTIEYGERVRSDDPAGLMITLADGSRVEMRSQTELSLDRADDGVRIRLAKGGVLVNAAKQRKGHLYVQTKDVAVSVIGTVFFVNAEEEGSRVAVIEGEVRVRQGASERRLRPGEQVATSPLMPSTPVTEEIAWSRAAKAHGQLLQQSTSAAESNRFEVISVRQESGNPGVRGAPIRCNAADGMLPGARRGDASVVARGRCAGRYVALIRLVAAAYGVPERNVSGGPDWMRSDSETFEIEAKAPSVTVTREQFREMLQKLLIERFRLRIHHDTREAPGYAIVVSKKGASLSQTSGDENLYLEQNGRRNQINLLGGGQVSVKGKATVQAFAAYLSVAPVIALNNVVDQTNLSGMYEFSLTLNMVAPDGVVRGGGLRGESNPSGPRIEWDPSISRAMEDQLGLSLASKKVSEDVIVIEQVEKPSEN